jgi:hypothetical protein
VAQRETAVRYFADDPSVGLTIADLNQFIQEAYRAGVDLRTPVMVVTGWKHQIKKIEVRG